MSMEISQYSWEPIFIWKYEYEYVLDGSSTLHYGHAAAPNDKVKLPHFSNLFYTVLFHK